VSKKKKPREYVIYARLTEEEHTAVSEYAAAEAQRTCLPVTISHIMRQALRAHLNSDKGGDQ